MLPGGEDERDIPEWVAALDMPVWITTSGGIVRYVNSQAESLIGHSNSACVGHSCYLVISGRTPEGEPLCAPHCRVQRLADDGRPIAPLPMQIAAAPAGQRDVTLLVINAGRDGLVHCAVGANPDARLRGFMDHVARRGAQRASLLHFQSDILTAREKEILVLLAQDLTQREIANRLSVSYATVRNHVQHILTKLGVHSILEAVAVSLIDEE